MKNVSPENRRVFKPIKIGDSLIKINKKFINKFGKLEFIIHAKWKEIVGVFFANHTEPEKITVTSISTDELDNKIYEKHLHVKVNPSIALEFQYFQGKVIEKINAYFGYKAIKDIKINQKFLINKDIQKTSKNKILYNISNKKIDIQKTSSNIKNKKLKESLTNLGLSILKESQ